MDNSEATPGDLLLFDQLIRRETLEGVGLEPALDWIAQLVDAAGDHSSEHGLRKAFDWIDELEARSPNDKVLAILGVPPV